MVYRYEQQSHTLNLCEVPSEWIDGFSQTAQKQQQSPTGFPHQQSSRQSSTENNPEDYFNQSDFEKVLNWSKMVRDNWNIHLLQQVLSGNDEDDLKYMMALTLRALNALNLYFYICNNQPVTVIVIGSFAPFGLHEGSAYHKFNKVFFQGVSLFLLIDLCPIAAPSSTTILGQRNASEKILGQSTHNEIMTILEGILRVICDGNQAIIVGCGDVARNSGNLADIIGDCHAHHLCCIYAGWGNIDKDYDSLVVGAKLQMKLFGNDNIDRK